MQRGRDSDGLLFSIKKVVLFQVHLRVHALHRQEVVTAGEDAWVLVQIDLSVRLTEDKVDFTAQDLFFPANLAVALRWAFLATY